MNRISNSRRLAVAAVALIVGGIAIAHGSAKSATPKKAKITTAGRSPVPSISVSGGISPDSFTLSRIFTWLTDITVSGGGWGSGESVNIVLHGPLNSGVAPTDRVIGTLVANGSGSIGGAVTIPYDPQPLIRPGYYEVDGVAGSGVAVAADKINICPATRNHDFAPNIDWGKERGGRDGPLTAVADQAPERIDPDWVSVWNEQPIQVYGTAADTNLDGANQPCFVAYHDFPPDHYAHDVNVMFVPDPEFAWIIGSQNYFGEPDDHETGRLEIEWEFLNDGNPSSYNTGVIGMAPFAMPTGGDRMFIVGRWILDQGHPENGARTEIHPPRMIATIRQRHDVMPLTPGDDCMTRAQKVDVYVSPHGGGSNRYLKGLTDALGSGGRISDILTGSDYDKYYRAGPITDGQLVALIALTSAACIFLPFPLNTICVVIAALVWGANIYEDAGPSAFGWGTHEPETGVVNDMDYDFDVPLPTAPSGATTPQAEVTPQVNDSGAVTEVITYTNPDPSTGLPTNAHVHLPYNGAANEIYARTIKFAWNAYSPPGRHFRVRNVQIEAFEDSDLLAGRWKMWLDVCGQWTQRSVDVSTTFSSDVFSMPGTFDVYVDPGQTLRVFAGGYEADNLEDGFGNTSNQNSYSFIFDLLNSYFLYDFSGDNDNLGGAFFQGDPVPVSLITGPHNIASDSPDGDYDLNFIIDYVPAPARIEVNGLPGNFGDVCLGGFQDKVVQIFNVGEDPLDVSSITISGAGFSRLPTPNVPFTVAGGEHIDITVRFAPTSTSQGHGTITFNSSDHCQPTKTFDLDAVTTYPVISSTPANTNFSPTVVGGCTTSSTITLFNTGQCELVISSATITGAAFTLDPVTLPIRLAPNATTHLNITFTPPAIARRFNGTLTMTTNDPTHPTMTNTFAGEGAPEGIRVLVLKADGSPYSKVDTISIQSHGVTPNTNTNIKNSPLTTLLPPVSVQRLQFHVERALPATGSSGNQGSYYVVKAKVGNKQQSVSFSLPPCTFKIIVITLQ